MMRNLLPTAAICLALLTRPAAAQTTYDRPEPTPVENARMARLAESVLGSRADVYLLPVHSPSGGVLPRWRTGEDGDVRTVTIFYEAPENPVEHGSGYRWAVNQAISHWTSVPGVALRFREAAGRETAQVTVKWVPHLSREHSGLTSWETDRNGWISTAVVTFALLGTDGKAMSRQMARRIALHELGHLIGLPHSPDEGDMMFPTSEQTRISSRDRASARLLYSVEPWVLLEMGSER